MMTMDQSELKRLRDGFERLGADDKQLNQATRAGFSRVATVLNKFQRKEARAANYPEAARAIGHSVHSKKKGRGRVFWIRSGIVKRKSPKWVKLWHLINLGTKAHHQPNAWRLIGPGRLVPMPGGAMHPGSRANPIRNKAYAKISPFDINEAFHKGFYRRSAKIMQKVLANP